MAQSLIVIAWISLGVALGCALLIAGDLVRRPQKMWIMNVVWPVTALYAGPLALGAYWRYGRPASKQNARREDGEKPRAARSFAASVGIGASHCGAGCTLGDLIAEWSVVLWPALGGFLFERRLFNTWIVDYAAAYILGIAFQYFTIAPMRHLRFWPGVWAAIKADSLSLTAWQVGMYGWMALAVFVLFGREIPATSPVFWFMMQVAMFCGFATAYPVNWWLIRMGMKEKM